MSSKTADEPVKDVSTLQSIMRIIAIGVGIIVGLWVVLALIMLAIVGFLKWRMRTEPFHLQPGFRIGSYDPSRYTSDWIVRRP